MPEVPIDSLFDPRLDLFRELKRRPEEGNSTFVAEGEKLVCRLLASGLATESIVCTPGVLDRLRPLIPRPVPVYVVATPLISELIGYQFHRGVLACGRVPPALSLIEFGAPPPEGRSLVVACPELRDPTNLGTIVRTAAGFGAKLLIAGSQGVSPWSRRVLRTSMGGVLTLPIVQTDDWDATLNWLHATGRESIAMVVADDAEPLRQANFSRHVAVFLGNEDAGLPARLAEQCRRRVTLPMAAGVDSLNVAVAAGIVFYQLSGIGS